MRIGLLSDTHGTLDEQIFHHFRHCDEIWHAGDIGSLAVLEKLHDFKTVRAVYGNIDGQAIRHECPEDSFFTCKGTSILITHIAGKPPSFNQRIRRLIQQYRPDILVCGHTHILRVVRQHGLLYLNPGACGHVGFHKVRTLLRFVIDECDIKAMEVIELGPNATY